MADEQFKEWMHYKQPNIPDLQDAFSAGRTAGYKEVGNREQIQS